jgi:type IV pilus assembly protein PilV
MSLEFHHMNVRRFRVHGFSLVEVLAALVVIAIGLLGIAKIQALAYASTATASQRSIAAIQAAGMAAAMRANRGYWAVGSVANTAVTVTGTAAASADTVFNGLLTTAGLDCTATGAAPCSGETLAAYDLQQWAAALNASLPGDAASIVCTDTTLPINCTISVQWIESTVAINSQGLNTGTAAALAGQQTYTLYVEP